MPADMLTKFLKSIGCVSTMLKNMILTGRFRIGDETLETSKRQEDGELKNLTKKAVFRAEAEQDP